MIKLKHHARLQRKLGICCICIQKFPPCSHVFVNDSKLFLKYSLISKKLSFLNMNNLAKKETELRTNIHRKDKMVYLFVKVRAISIQ